MLGQSNVLATTQKNIETPSLKPNTSNTLFHYGGISLIVLFLFGSVKFLQWYSKFERIRQTSIKARKLDEAKANATYKGSDLKVELLLYFDQMYDHSKYSKNTNHWVSTGIEDWIDREVVLTQVYYERNLIDKQRKLVSQIPLLLRSDRDHNISTWK